MLYLAPRHASGPRLSRPWSDGVRPWRSCPSRQARPRPSGGRHLGAGSSNCERTTALKTAIPEGDRNSTRRRTNSHPGPAAPHLWNGENRLPVSALASAWLHLECRWTRAGPHIQLHTLIAPYNMQFPNASVRRKNPARHRVRPAPTLVAERRESCSHSGRYAIMDSRLAGPDSALGRDGRAASARP
jgi:hypothetical protein